MAYIEKVIDGLEFTKAMITFNPSTGEDIEPENLNEADKTSYDACVGAIALLKEQETKWIHRADMDYKDKNGVVHFHGMCESCGFIHDFIDGHTGQYKFCPECGSKNEQWKDGDGE